MPKNEALFQNIANEITNSFLYATNPAFWSLVELGVNLYDNQIEIVNAVCDLNLKSLAILQSRGGGKTRAVAVGLIKLALDYPGIQIGIFAPKAQQAERLVKEITQTIVRPATSVYAKIDWNMTTNSRVKFANGSEILALSAADTTQNEGNHFHVIVCDEVHRISEESMNSRIIPMLAALQVGKIVKLGIPVGKGQWFTNCNSPNTPYVVLKRDWTQCPILLGPDSVFYKGQELPRYVIEQMPLPMKRALFPDRPELHTEGSLTEADFAVQYGMDWQEDIDQLLSEENQKRLILGAHDILEKARRETQEVYYFGLDMASGSLSPRNADRDFTALSIWRKRGDGTKEKVASFELRGDRYPDQLAEIESIIHPTQGVFPCAFGLVDYSNTGSALVDTLKQRGFPLDGINFATREVSTGKNYKNAMFNHLILELESGRVKFPSLDKLQRNPVMLKSYEEWRNIQRHVSKNGNDQIQAPSDFHDDHCCADALAVWAMDKGSAHHPVAQALPQGIVVPGMTMSSFGFGQSLQHQRSNCPYLPEGVYNPTQPHSGPNLFGTSFK